MSKKTSAPGKMVEQQLRDLEALLGIHITVHDKRGVFRTASGKPLFQNRNVHHHPYCLAGRYLEPGWNNRCCRDCVQCAETKALRKQEPFTKICWKGVYEIVVPVVAPDGVVAVLYAGGFRAKVPDLAALPGQYRQMQKLLPVRPSRPECERIIRLLTLLGQGLVGLARIAEPPVAGGYGRREQIQRFLGNHAHRPIGLPDLAEFLCLSPSRVSHLLRELFNLPFRQLLNAERLQRARLLLASGEQSLDAVSRATGFTSVYYFSHAFRRHFGQPPGAYRRDQGKSTNTRHHRTR